MKNFVFCLLFTGVIFTSFVFTGDVLAQSEIIISADTDKNSYEEGDKIIVSGKIKNFDSETHSAIALTYRATDPEGSIISLGQVLPDSAGDFSFDFDAGGSFFNQNGEYSVQLFFESSTKDISFIYDGANDSIPQPESNPDSNLNDKIITVIMKGQSIFYFDSPNQIIRATVEIQNFTPSDGQYFMKVTHLPTQKVLKDFEIYPKNLGNDVWGVEIAYPILESDIKLGGQTLVGEFEIHVRTEFDSLTASTTFSIVESKKDLPVADEPEKQIDPPSLDLDAGPSDTSETEIPDWVKTNAEWWAKGNISESEFLSSVEYLLENKIMKITLTKNDNLPSITTVYTLPDSRSTEYAKITGEFSEKHLGTLTLTVVKPDQSEETITTISRDGTFMTTMALTADSLVGTYQVFAEIEGNQILTSTFEVKDADVGSVPSWIKNNAEWWAQDLISDDDFVKGIQYLIEQGIIKV